jgi:predicted TIM-barrel fold metal-dependent hydrolase
MATGHDGPNPHFPVRPAWLARHEEPVLEPALPIVDPHHHLWDRPEGAYFLHDLLADLSTGHRIEATVFAECGAMYRAGGPPELRPVGEVEFANGAAAMSASGGYGPTEVCAGIIGHADLRLGEAAEPVLEAHLRAGGGRFRGIRQIAAWHPDPAARASLASPPPGLLADPGLHRGAAVLARLGLSFDTYLYHTQLPELAALADAVPDLTIVLDHTGGAIGIGPYAGRRDEVFAAWSAGIRELARRPNLHVKVGGMGMRVFGFGFGAGETPPSSADLAAAWAPYAEACIEAFGADRCMFESNFPVDKGSCAYPVLWNAFKRIAAGAGAAEKAALFAGTARRVYRLG